MKNIFTLFTVSFIFAIILLSCKKGTVTNTVYIKDTSIINTTVIRDTTTTTDLTLIRDSVYPSGIVGFWPGLYNSPGDNPIYQCSFLFRNNGTVRVYINGADTITALAGEGIYNIIGYTVSTQFNLNISGTLYLYSTYGTVDSNFIFYQGTIGQGLNTSGLEVNIAYKQ